MPAHHLSMTQGRGFLHTYTTLTHHVEENIVRRMIDRQLLYNMANVAKDSIPYQYEHDQQEVFSPAFC